MGKVLHPHHHSLLMDFSLIAVECCGADFCCTKPGTCIFTLFSSRLTIVEVVPAPLRAVGVGPLSPMPVVDVSLPDEMALNFLLCSAAEAMNLYNNYIMHPYGLMRQIRFLPP